MHSGDCHRISGRLLCHPSALQLLLPLPGAEQGGAGRSRTHPRAGGRTAPQPSAIETARRLQGNSACRLQATSPTTTSKAVVAPRRMPAMGCCRRQSRPPQGQATGRHQSPPHAPADGLKAGGASAGLLAFRPSSDGRARRLRCCPRPCLKPSHNTNQHRPPAHPPARPPAHPFTRPPAHPPACTFWVPRSRSSTWRPRSRWPLRWGQEGSATTGCMRSIIKVQAGAGGSGRCLARSGAAL